MIPEGRSIPQRDRDQSARPERNRCGSLQREGDRSYLKVLHASAQFANAAAMPTRE